MRVESQETSRQTFCNQLNFSKLRTGLARFLNTSNASMSTEHLLWVIFHISSFYQQLSDVTGNLTSWLSGHFALSPSHYSVLGRSQIRMQSQNYQKNLCISLPGQDWPGRCVDSFPIIMWAETDMTEYTSSRCGGLRSHNITLLRQIH